MTGKRGTLHERFHRHFKIAETDGCWVWHGATSRQANGSRRAVLKNQSRCVIAARVAWELHHGPIPNGLWVLHECDNQLCVNPNHLFLGTHTDNMRDAAAKGRIVIPNRLSRYTQRQIIILRATGLTMLAISTRLKIGLGSVHKYCALEAAAWMED